MEDERNLETSPFVAPLQVSDCAAAWKEVEQPRFGGGLQAPGSPHAGR